jgi:hypothetical protein
MQFNWHPRMARRDSFGCILSGTFADERYTLLATPLPQPSESSTANRQTSRISWKGGFSNRRLIWSNASEELSLLCFRQGQQRLMAEGLTIAAR